MKTLEMMFDQRTPEWHSARSGCVTGSPVKKTRMFLKNGTSSAEREAYKIQLVAERMTGQIVEFVFVNKEMQRGIDKEPEARVAYELFTGNAVREVGFIKCLDAPMGVSPDGLVIGERKGIEIKCPATTTHIKWMLAGVCPEEHMDQVQFLMHLADLDAVDFISFDDRLPKHLQLFIMEVKRDNDYIAAMMKDVNQFLTEVDELTKKLDQLQEKAA